MVILLAFGCNAYAQRYSLFAPQIRNEYPSAVYDFLERYLYELDSLENKGVNTAPKLRDDKVTFLTGGPQTARNITPSTPFSINKTEEKFYQVTWTDATGAVLLDLVFPMQYELILGKPKVEIEKEFRSTVQEYSSYLCDSIATDSLIMLDDSCYMSQPVLSYYVPSVNMSSYYRPFSDKGYSATFDAKDKAHSAANLFQCHIQDVGNRRLCVVQHLYGFKTIQYTIPIVQWLSYCQAMKMKTFFAVEEEREDGLKALLIAQSPDLGFNHMFSLIIPNDFVEKEDCVIKGDLNAYIPTQNVKDLYQQPVNKPKKKI